MRLWRDILLRSLQTAVTLFAVATLMWVMFRLIPGDPTTIFLGTGELPPAALEALRKSWGLDAPLYRQYLDYVANLLTGNLGLSFYFRRPVFDVIAPMLLNTLRLMGTAMAIATAIGVFAGAYLGWRRGDRIEQIVGLVVLVPRSLPIFWIGVMLLMIFSYGLGWFPIGGLRTPAFIPESAWEELPGFAFGGQVLLEVVFSWPGMGSLMVSSVAQRDYPVAQAAFFLMAVITILLNLLIDVLYVFLDPRIRYE